jgi:hypothetical protein
LEKQPAEHGSEEEAYFFHVEWFYMSKSLPEACETLAVHGTKECF